MTGTPSSPNSNQTIAAVTRFAETPGAVFAVARPAQLTSIAYLAAGGGPTGRTVRGSRMRTRAALFNELAAALQLPLGFGGNLDALYDALTDLDWYPRRPVVIAFADAGDVLVNEPAEQFEKFVALLNDIVAASQTTQRPVSVLLAGDTDRWHQSGAQLGAL